MKAAFRRILATMPKRIPFVLIALAAAGALCVARPTTSADQGGIESMRLKVGFSAGTFTSVDQREAQAALQLWTRQLAREMGIRTPPETVVFTRTQDLLAAVNRGELSVVNLPAIDYLDIRTSARMSPSLVAAGYHENKYRYLIVARRDSGITSIPKLRGRSLVMATRKIYTVGYIWLSVLLSKKGCGEPSKFLGEIKESISPSKALLNVYFRKHDAAMLSRGALETSIALNPQLGRQLTILAESENFPGVITCIPHNVSKNLRHRIEEKTTRLHESSVGKQMFTLFQMDRAVPFQPSYLSGLEDLVRDWNRLPAKRGRK